MIKKKGCENRRSNYLIGIKNIGKHLINIMIKCGEPLEGSQVAAGFSGPMRIRPGQSLIVEDARLMPNQVQALVGNGSISKSIVQVEPPEPESGFEVVAYNPTVTIVPNCTGFYIEFGSYNGRVYYARRGDSAYVIWFLPTPEIPGTIGAWVISEALGDYSIDIEEANVWLSGFEGEDAFTGAENAGYFGWRGTRTENAVMPDREIPRYLPISNTLLVSGTLDPNATGIYTFAGYRYSVNHLYTPYWTNGIYTIWWNYRGMALLDDAWVITISDGPGWLLVVESGLPVPNSVIGAGYVPDLDSPATGDATVSVI